MRTLETVVEESTEKIIKSQEFFARDISEIFKQRAQLQQAFLNNHKLWVCPICRDPIKIRGKQDGDVSLHFYHILNNKFCPLKEEKQLSKDELLRYRYNGQKEGERHQRLKELIESKILKDKRFSKPNVEKRLNGACGKWRQPDVSTSFEGKIIAFEIQLSTTFLSVINERNKFYKDNGIFIIWIFDKSYTSVEDMRFTEKDIFFPNHHNAFFIDEKDMEDKFALICGYEVPEIKNGKIIRKYFIKKIAFEELTFDDNFNTFYFNFDSQKSKIESELEQNKINYFINNLSNSASHNEYKSIIESNGYLFAKHGINTDDYRFQRLLNCILSIKLNRVFGYNYEKIIQALHIFLESDSKHKTHYGHYIFDAIKCYNMRNVIIAEDTSEKFYKKAREYHNKGYHPDGKYDSILKVISPELTKWRTQQKIPEKVN